MPALISHHLFGEDAANRLPADLVVGQEELLAFLLGNQGPDPLLASFSTTPATAAACHRFAHKMHEDKIVEALLSARSAVSFLPESDKRVGNAYSLGLLAHYILDSAGNPFVSAQVEALCAADPNLLGSEESIHAIIESDLDVWLLWSQRGQTIIDAPASSDLMRTDRITRVAGALLSHIALQVFGLDIGADSFGASVDDYELIYALIDPAPSVRTTALARVEELLLGGRRLKSLAHYVTTTDECPAANLERHPWTDPATHAERTDSFADIYFDSLDRWPAFVSAFVQGDAEALERLVSNRNYEGLPIQ